jgi:hypothetical protein
MTALDYLRNAVLWLPIATVCLLLYIFCAVVLVRFGLKYLDEKRYGAFRNIVRYTGLTLGSFIAASWLWDFVEGAPSVYIVWSLLIIVSCFVLFQSHTLIGASSLLALTLLLIVSAVGAAVATASLNDFDLARYEVSVTEHGDRISQRVVILKSLEKGVLLFAPATQKVMFYRWETVDLIAIRTDKGHHSRLCKWTGFFCPPVTEPP